MKNALIAMAIAAIVAASAYYFIASISSSCELESSTYDTPLRDIIEDPLFKPESGRNFSKYTNDIP